MSVSLKDTIQTRKMKYLISLLLIVCFSISSTAQISHGGSPLSQQATFLNKKVPTVKMDNFNLQAMLEEDEIYNVKGAPYRFGKEFSVNYGINNSGIWETLPNGARLWRLSVESENAHSLNFVLNEYELPIGATLFIYNKDYENVLGSFTAANNKSYGRLATSIIKGNKVTFEYYEPANKIGEGKLNIGKVVHGYRDYSYKTKEYGDSGSCNNNVNCPESAGWEDQINSAAMMVLGGFRWCSGAMLNNLNEDGTPYYLTADHCVEGLSISQIEEFVFMFNYQSPSCANQDGPTSMTVSGCELKAQAPGSDFCLLELSDIPPPDYNVFLAGWDKSGDQPTRGVGIHHPAGDIKKISFDEDALDTEGSYWRVNDWDDGTTEGGSSGSPIFNAEQRIVGQLYGGLAACENDEYDIYGKIDVSWGNAAQPATSLQPWLDPNNTGTDIVDGVYINASLANLDASLLASQSLALTTCETTIDLPGFSLKNTGTNPIETATIIWQINDNPPTIINWTGNLESFQSEIIDLPTQNFELGAHIITISFIDINGGDDENADNNTIILAFEVIEGINLNITLDTDDYGSETSLEIIEQGSGVVLFTANGFESNENYNLAHCLGDGCYDFVITDSYGDGICCAYGQGSYDISMSDGSFSASGGEFATQDTQSFCVSLNTEVAPTANVTFENQSVCLGETVSITAESFNYDNISWLVDGQSINNTLVLNYSFNEAGIYDISFSATNAFGTTEIEVGEITVVENPSQPVIVLDNPEVCVNIPFAIEALVNNYTTLNWNFDGATHNFNQTTSSGEIVFEQTGLYTINVEALNLNCGSVTTNVEVTVIEGEACFPISTVKLDESGLRVFPNPASSGWLTIEGQWQSANAQFFSIDGKQVENLTLTNGLNKVVIDKLTSGIYLLQITTEGGAIINQKIIVD